MGYAVCYNKFSDVEPIQDEDGYIQNWEYFTEDILQIVQMRILDGEWGLPREGKIIIDLGWYPDGQPDGQYKLVQVDEHWQVIRETESKDRFLIKNTLEEWLENLLFT
ncbi:hypothetical protein [Paenibacillus caseinilyticus]|nr:hypothetical protein [Paenibacillus caseinilyticus]MCZ8520831.1 hypothetical protein [Paenibacillus caseinilyticus]